jgi:hypothetical protein
MGTISSAMLHGHTAAHRATQTVRMMLVIIIIFINKQPPFSHIHYHRLREVVILKKN